MGLEMSPGIVVAKLDTMNVSLSRIIDHAQKMIYEISELENTKDQLAGEAYDCIRNHFADMHTAVVRAVILYAEAMIQENNSYIGYINGYLGGMGYVNEDKLKEDRYALKDQINRAYSLMIATKCGSYSSWISSMEYALRLIEDKLDLIGDFKAASGGLYSDIDSYKATLENGIKSLHSAVFDGKTISYPVDYIDRGWKREVESRWGQREQRIIETIKEPFVQNMETHFGFDRNTAAIMYKLYEEMDMRGGENIDQEYFAILASITYPYGEKSPNGHNYLWKYLAGTETEEETKQKLSYYGLSDDEIECLYGSVTANHIVACLEENDVVDKINQRDLTDVEREDLLKVLEQQRVYFGKVDLGHMSVTIATILNPDDTIYERCGNASGIFNGIYDLNANAGYVGDVYGTAGNGPKLTADDYQADLDAVNLSTRINNDENLIDVMNEYYSGISRGEINRADEFACNLGNGDRNQGIAYLQQQSRDNLAYILGKYELKDAATLVRMYNNEEVGKVYQNDDAFGVFQERQKIVRNFINSIINSQNTYCEYESVDANLAEQGKIGKW